MKTKQVIESEIDELRNRNFLFVRPPDEDGGFFVNKDDKDTVVRASEVLKISPEAVLAIDEALTYLVDEFIVSLKSDLEDIWERLE